MIQRGIILLALVTCLNSINNIAKAQSYDIESFQGVKTKISLYYKPFSGLLKISSLKDTIFIADYLAINDVHVLNRTFLQISYATRGGANEGIGNLLLLCVDNGKLYQAMHVRSFFNYDMRNISHIKGNLSEYQLFKLKVQLLGNSKNAYKLNVSIHDESSSERTPKTNHNYNKQAILSFDPNQNVFYSTHQDLSKSFTVYDPKTQQSIKQEVKGTLPVVTLDKSDYYYIKDGWYEKGINNSLLKYTY